MRVKWIKNVKFKIKNETISKVDKVKYLDLIFDERFTWKGHSPELQAKLRKLNYLFLHLKNYFGKNHLKEIYIALHESVMYYNYNSHTSTLPV